MHYLRKICKLSLWQKKTNKEVLLHCKMETVEALVSFRRLRWLGHVARMDDDRLPRKVLFGNLMSGAGVAHRKVGKNMSGKIWLSCT